MTELARPVDGSARSLTTLTPRESVVLTRVRRACARSGTGTVLAGMIGSPGTCRALAEKGYLTVELHKVGPLGGQYYRYRLPGPRPDGPQTHMASQESSHDLDAEPAQGPVPHGDPESR